MSILIAREALMLSAASPPRVSTTLALPTLTETLAVSLHRPTASRPLAWNEGGTLRVHIIVEVDGVEYRCTGQSGGGVRLGLGGLELPEYRLLYRLPWGFFGAREGAAKRLGEMSRTAYRVRVELERVSGSIETAVELLGTEALAPLVPFRSSVAFDMATDAQEMTGDGVLSLTHTSTGSDRGAFAGNANVDNSPQTSTSINYAGSGMTERWDFSALALYAQAGYSTKGQVTGPQTVTSTLPAGASEHYLGVVSMTGVHQTTEVGTPATGSGTTSPATVTVGSVGADDLVVDNLLDSTNAPTVGADQTVRNTETGSVLPGEFRQSTQPGTAGGVMSWTFTNTDWLLGAIAFKPAPPAPPSVDADYSAFPKHKIREAVLRGEM